VCAPEAAGCVSAQFKYKMIHDFTLTQELATTRVPYLAFF